MYKQFIEEIDIEQEKSEYKQDVEYKTFERTSFNHSPVTFNQIMETAAANTISNIPEMTAVATTASMAVGIVGAITTKGAGYPVAKAASMIVASKVLPGIMIASEYISALWKSKTQPAWQANIEQMTIDEALEMETGDISKGVIESMTLGKYVPKGAESTQRMIGNMAGSIVRDYLLVAGIPIPGKAVIESKLGKGAVNEIMLGVAMTMNNGVEDYNKAINTGKSQDEAYTMQQASMIGNGTGSIIGFGILPRFQKILSKGAFGGNSMFGKLTGGINLAGYETTRKLTGGLVIDATERAKGKEITNDYEMTMGDGLAMFSMGTLFSAAPWGLGKIVKASTFPIRYPAGKIAERFSESSQTKRAAKDIADNLTASYAKSTLNGEAQDFIQRELTKGMVDNLIKEVAEDIDKGVNKDKAIMEAFRRLPGEFTNEKNIRSISEVFRNVI